MKNRIFRNLGSVVMLFALVATSTASWILIEQPETPDTLK